MRTWRASSATRAQARRSVSGMLIGRGMFACHDAAMADLPDNVRALFERANFVHVASVLPGGAPHSVPVWAGMEGDRIAFFTQPASRKARNLAADPRVALSVVDHDNPYLTAQVRGRVVETVE